MARDLEALNDAIAWVERDGDKKRRHKSLAQQLDNISKRHSLRIPTREALRYARDCIETGLKERALLYLTEQQEKYQ